MHFPGTSLGDNEVLITLDNTQISAAKYTENILLG
jgi:hypothetical protein